MAQTVGLSCAHLPRNIFIFRAYGLCVRSAGTSTLYLQQAAPVKKYHSTARHLVRPGRRALDSDLKLERWPSFRPPQDFRHQVSSLGYGLTGMTASMDVVSAVKYLTRKQYEHLRSTVPHTEDMSDADVFYYLWSSKKLSKVMEPMIDHSAVKVLAQLIEENIPNYTPSEATEIIKSLVFMGYDTTSPVFHKLLTHAKTNIKNMDVKDLDRLSLMLLEGRDFNMIKQIIDRCLHLLEADAIPRNDATLSAFCSLVKKILPFCPHSTEKIYNYVLDLTKSMPFDLQSKDTFVTIINTVCQLTPRSRKIQAQKQIIDAGKLNLVDRINEFQPIHLQTLSDALRFVHQYDDATRTVIDTRIKNLIEQGNISFSDVFHLHVSLSKRSEPQLIKLLEQLMEKIVNEVDLDERLVTKLATALYNVESTNIKLIKFVQSKAADCDIEWPLVLFLTQQEFVSQKHKKALADSLFSNVETNGIHHFQIAHIYLLAHMLPLHEELYIKLLQIIDTWDARKLSKFLEGLFKWQRQARIKHTPSYNKQINTLLSRVCKNIINKLDVSDLHVLRTITRSLSSHTVKYHSASNYLQILMDQFWSSNRPTIVNASPRSLDIILSCCISTNYFSPELCNYVSEAVMNSEELQHALFFKLFVYLGHCGYTPHNMDSLMPKAFWLLEELYKAGSLHEYLEAISNIVILNGVPENALISIFTTEFLQHLLKHFRMYPRDYLPVAGHLVFLNQCAVMDYPHLGIHWVSDEVGKMLEDKRTKPRYPMSVIEQVVGGAEYYKAQTKTRYSHLISFELLMDNENNLLAWNHNSNSENIQRIAIILEGAKKASLVPKGVEPRFGGKRKREMIHMQKLGYKVVGVPHHEWKGKTRKEHVELLQQKLSLPQR